VVFGGVVRGISLTIIYGLESLGFATLNGTAFPSKKLCMLT
jgi:hypothetical protein